MSWKQFLKPDWRKIIITIIILFLTIFYNTRTEILPQPKTRYYQGFPFEWWIYEAGGTVIGYLIFNIPVELLYSGRIILTGFIADIIFWYLLSCLIVWIYDKVKKKK
jgi:hypothetical protein